MTRTDVQFAQWLQANYPPLFAALAARARSPTDMGLSGWGDIFSSIGSGLTSAASNIVQYGGQAINAVASYLGSDGGQKTLGQLASLYVASQANHDALAVQVANQQAGKAPAPIQTTVEPVTGTVIPIYAPTGQAAQPLTPSIVSTLLSSAKKPQIMTPIFIGGGLVLAAIILKRRA